MMTEIQKAAEAELVWLELAQELAYRNACDAWIAGSSDEVPDPGEFGLSERLGCEIAAEAVRDDAEQGARWYDEAAAAYEQVRRFG